MAIIRVSEAGQEPFLVNPIGTRIGGRKPGKARKPNKWPGEKGAHRSAASVGWSQRKVGIKGYAESKGAKYPRIKNALGEALLIVSNPTGGSQMAKTKEKSRKRKNPVMKAAAKSGSKRRNPLVKSGRRKNPRRRNPIVGGMDFGQILTGAVSAIATVSIPNILKVQSPLMKYGSQVATAIAGKFVIDRMLSGRNGNTFMTVGLSITVADAIREYVLSKVTLMTAVGAVSMPAGTAVSIAPAATPDAKGVGMYHNVGLHGMGAYLNKLPKTTRIGMPNPIGI